MCSSSRPRDVVVRCHAETDPATDDPYEAAAAFVEAGWSLIFQTSPDSGDPLACVGPAGAQVMAEGAEQG